MYRYVRVGMEKPVYWGYISQSRIDVQWSNWCLIITFIIDKSGLEYPVPINHRNRKREKGFAQADEGNCVWKKAAKYEGVSRYAYKLRQFYKFYLIASFFLNKHHSKKSSAKALTSFRSPFFDYRPRTFSSWQVTVFPQHTANQTRLPTARLSLLYIYTSMP